MIRVALLLLLALSALPARAEEVDPEDGNAIESCREDRACRQRVLRLRLEVSRLARDAERYERLKREAALAEMDRQRVERMKRDAAPIRSVRTIEADLFLSTSDLIGRGVLAGWGSSAQFRWEVFLTYSTSSSYQTLERAGGQYSSTSTYSDGTLAGARLRWIPYQEGAIGMYVAGGPVLLDLDINSYTYSSNGGDGGSGGNEIGIAHAFLGAAGIDFQLRMGIHFALEFQYLKPWYVQALDAQTQLENTARKDQLVKDINDENIGVGFVMGWAW